MAPVGPGDPYLNVWILGWDLRTLTSDPLALVTGRIFNANIFYPADLTLAYSDHLILQAVALWPLYLVLRDVTLCYNVLLFGSLLVPQHARVRLRSPAALKTRVSGSRGVPAARCPPAAHRDYSCPRLPFLHRLMAGRRRSMRSDSVRWPRPGDHVGLLRRHRD
jgi:hypothetical protein